MSSANKVSYDQYPVYNRKDLELVYTPDYSTFILWAPSADQVRLNLYIQGDGGEPYEQWKMAPAGEGTWKIRIDRDLKGLFYTFQIRIDNQWKDETPGVWVKAVGINGKRGAILDPEETNPSGWETESASELDHFTDIIIYEMHFRDISVSSDSGIRHKGKFLAMTEVGTMSPDGKTTGLDHIKELGVTHLHILPSFDFASIDESLIYQPIYNWGYDPLNFNAVEGSYSTDPFDPAVRIKEFKQMIQTLHANGLRVILDVVYNHTYQVGNSNFDLTAPGYFYRQDEDGNYSDATGCGNETASERAMFRKFMIDSVTHWVREYHIDGFRFDLMGVHDLDTMNSIKETLHAIDPTIFIYGEGWTASESVLPADRRAMKINALNLTDVAVFNDDFRDALRGHVFEREKGGFIVGETAGNEETIKFGIVGSILHPQINYNKILYSTAPYANHPPEVVNYISCHDDYCLIDKIKCTTPGSCDEEDLKRFAKLGHTILFTAQGIPFLRAGEELFHDKKGEHNSHKSPDYINQIEWKLKLQHEEFYEYIKELIRLRKEHPAFRIPTAEGVREWLRFMEKTPKGVIAYTLGEHAHGDPWKEIVVIINGNRKKVYTPIPSGGWDVICRDGKIDRNGMDRITGGEITIEPSSVLILCRY